MGIPASNLEHSDWNKHSSLRYWEGPETVGRVEGNTDTTPTNPRVTAPSETGGLVSTPLDAFEGQFRRQERHKSKAPSGRVERNSCPRSLFSPCPTHLSCLFLFYLSPLSLPLLISAVPSVLNWLGDKGSPHVFSRLLLLSLAINLLMWASEKSEYICFPGSRLR